jgi:molecular chaperone GrpE
MTTENTPDPNLEKAAELNPQQPSGDMPGAQEPPSLEVELAIAKAAASSARDDYLRALAEQDNIRKRAMTDVAQARDFASKNFAMDLLSVRDTLEAVLADKVSTPEQLKMGVEMTLKQLTGAFERNKVKEINPVGQKFDPNLHQAMQEIESDQAPGTVTQVMQKGYVLAERLLRPAMVLVAKAKPNDAPPAA